MFKEIQPEMVLVAPDPVAEKSDGGIELPTIAKDNLMKSQNRGTVVLLGKDVSWPQKGDWVSFYRNAATELEEDGKKYLIVHKNHVLASIISDEKTKKHTAVLTQSA